MNNESLYQMELALQEVMNMVLSLVQVLVALQKSLAPEEIEKDEYYGNGDYSLTTNTLGAGHG